MKVTGNGTTTAEALLGILSLAPMSGYGIRQQIEESTGNFWQESFGQIYPTLKRLRAEGLVSMRSEGRGRTATKVYSLTEAGRARLRAWIGTASTPQVARNEMLLKIFFGNQVGTEAVREQIEAYRELNERDLARYQAIEEGLRAARGRDPRLPYWLMTLRYGQAQSRAGLAWVTEALGMCAAIEDSGALTGASAEVGAADWGGGVCVGEDGRQG